MTVLELLQTLKKQIKDEEITREEAMSTILYYKETSEGYEGITLRPDRTMSFLKSAKFFTLPASLKHHGNWPGGLFDHSLQVAIELQTLTDRLGLTWKDRHSPVRIGLLHDICKIKVPEEMCSDINPKGINLYPGHGLRSVMLLEDMGFFDLTLEERLCIFHHMGAFEKDWWNEFSVAVAQNPNVLYTHTADMIASQVKGV